MVVSTQENGKTIKWKAVEYFNGQMVGDTRVNTLMIRKRVKDLFFGKSKVSFNFFLGLMVASTRVSG